MIIDLSKYKPSDFSPIHKRNEKPTKEGYYVTEHIIFYDLFILIHDGLSYNSPCTIFHYWDGMAWLGSNMVKFPHQDFAWFGLRENPNG
jgi:hypothetical protein